MQAARPSKRSISPWFILAVVSLPVFIGALDLTIISAVLPEVIISLKLPVKEYLDQASWAVNAYLLAYAISMTFTGRLSDLFGRRNVYIACLIIFMFGSYFVTIYDSALINRTIARFYHTFLNQRPPRLEVRHLYLVITGRANSGVWGWSDGSGHHCPCWRSVPTRTPRPPDWCDWRSRYDGLGAWTPLRRCHGAFLR